MELRRRLAALVGDDARGVTVLTYHAMALRLTGTSLQGVDRQGGTIDFDKLIQDAIDLLEGRTDAFADADEARDQETTGLGSISPDDIDAWIEQNGIIVTELSGKIQFVIGKDGRVVG